MFDPIDNCIQDLLGERDAVMLGQGPDIDAFLSYYTVPLFLFHGDAPEPAKFAGSSTGVLLKLGNRGFILTAGHCVRDAAGKTIMVGVAKQAHRFRSRLDAAAFVYEGGSKDYGYFEIPAVEWATYDAHAKMFMAPSRIEVLSPAEFGTIDDWFVLSGYPGAAMRVVDEVDEVGHGFSQIHVSTTPAGLGVAPASTLAQPGSDVVTVDLWIPEAGNLNTTSGRFEEISVPVLAGASGGGCWRGHVRPDPEGWTPSRFRLVGIHIGSTQIGEAEINGEKHRFSREVWIGHHLALIARNYPDLERTIYETWPILAPAG